MSSPSDQPKIPTTHSSKSPAIRLHSDWPKGTTTVCTKSAKQEDLLKVHSAPKSVEAEYIRSLHKQIYLLELENKYMRGELEKSNTNSSKFADATSDKKLSDNLHETQLLNRQIHQHTEELKKRCDEIQDKLNREIALRKEQLDIFTQDILKIKSEKEVVIKENQEKDEALDKLKAEIRKWEDRFIDAGEMFEACKQALINEIRRRKALERKMKEQKSNVLLQKRTSMSADTRSATKNQFQPFSSSGDLALLNNPTTDHRSDLFEYITELYRQVKSQSEELDKLKKAVYQSEGESTPASRPSLTQPFQVDGIMTAEPELSKLSLPSFPRVTRAHWQDVDTSQRTSDIVVQEEPIQPTKKKAPQFRL
uniref:CCDC81 n=1 Tax=Mesocestoides corti TaxID=53468 RepID=A0A5K3EL50_MESCO